MYLSPWPFLKMVWWKYPMQLLLVLSTWRRHSDSMVCCKSCPYIFESNVSFIGSMRFLLNDFRSILRRYCIIVDSTCSYMSASEMKPKLYFFILYLLFTSKCFMTVVTTLYLVFCQACHLTPFSSPYQASSLGCGKSWGCPLSLQLAGRELSYPRHFFPPIPFMPWIFYLPRCSFSWVQS